MTHGRGADTVGTKSVTLDADQRPPPTRTSGAEQSTDTIKPARGCSFLRGRKSRREQFGGVAN